MPNAPPKKPQAQSAGSAATIKFPAQIEARLANLAKATGRTKSFYAREAILQHLDDLEDRYVAEQRLIDLKAGRSASTSLEDVLSRYGMEDRA